MRAPMFNILGSYFPSWIVCCAGAAFITFAVHRLFVKWNLLAELWSLPLVYAAMFVSASCTLWIIFFK